VDAGIKRRLVAAVAALLVLGAAELPAQSGDDDDSPASAAGGAGRPRGGGGPRASPSPGPSASPGASSGRPRRYRRRSQPRDDPFEEPAGRTVWTESASARVKTRYDDSGNIVYQKAWDKKSHREVPVPEAGREPEQDTSRNIDLREPTDARPYGRLRRDFDGDYEEHRSDPRPQYRSHHLHQYGPPAEKHPYEFSLSGLFWANTMRGTVQGTGGTSGTLVADRRTSFSADFHNPRAGYSLLMLDHTAPANGTFTFRGATFSSGAIFTEEIQTLDGFYRWGLTDGQDTWVDFLLGLRLFRVDARVTQGAATASVTGTVPLPELGLIGAYSLLDNIRIRGFFKGAFGAASGNSALIIDSETEFVYEFPGDFEYAFVNEFGLGFKVLSINFRANQNTANAAQGTLDFTGPFFKFAAHF
jgi:hypothetical protein